VCGNRDVQRNGFDVGCLQREGKPLDVFASAGHDTRRRTVDDCQIHTAAQMCRDGLWGSRHTEHRARRQIVEETPSKLDERDRIVEGEHARQAGCRVLPETVPDDRDRLDAQIPPVLSHRILDGEQHREAN
jgi:hypothetical protein